MSKASEQAFFDQHAEHSPRESVRKYYAIAKRSHDHFHQLIRDAAPGNHVLEYGCGVGNFSFELAALGARVTGIDISPKSVEVATSRAKERGHDDMSFSVMDAENMDFPDDTFDVVVGSAILHHLDLERCSTEIMRVLKPGGLALFLEPLGHNPALNLFRKLTPKMRTDDEHPLTIRELQYLADRMGEARYTFFHVSTFFAIPFLKTPMFWRMVQAMDGLDRVTFKVCPPLRAWAWFVTMEYRKQG